MNLLIIIRPYMFQKFQKFRNYIYLFNNIYSRLTLKDSFYVLQLQVALIEKTSETSKHSETRGG